jgi:hypothetical protein
MIKIIEQIEGLVSNKLLIIKTILSVFKLEAKLACMSVFPLLLNLLMMFTIIISSWLSLMLLTGYGIVILSGSIMYGISAVLVVNLCVLLALFRYLSYNFNNMSFKKTRTYLAVKESH